MNRASAAIVLAVVLSDCTASQPEKPPREETMAPAPPVRPATRPLLRGSWRFEQDAATCVATLVAGRTTLTVSVRRNSPVPFVLALDEPVPATARLRFAGSAGSWQVGAQRAGAQSLSAILGVDTLALSRLLVLLGGGTLEIGDDKGLPAISLPAAGAQGQAWFDCGRDKLGP